MALLGGALVAGSETAPFGLTVFIALPIATGFTSACFTRLLSAILLTSGLSILLSCLALLFTGKEGVVCIVFALPLILVGAVIGAVLGWLVRGWIDSPANLALFPLVGILGVFGIGAAEDRLGGDERIEPVTSVVTLDASAEEVWSALLAPDDVSANRPLLLRMGLPVPLRCSLEGTGLGARRTCYFDSGVIEERVTRWEPARRLDFQIVRSTLPGRHWLGFESASYIMEELDPRQTRVTRMTTITSKLCPAWYWRHFEHMGVDAEHRYLFESLGNALTGAGG
jgi:hypothetical protein